MNEKDIKKIRLSTKYVNEKGIEKMSLFTKYEDERYQEKYKKISVKYLNEHCNLENFFFVYKHEGKKYEASNKIKDLFEDYNDLRKTLLMLTDLFLEGYEGMYEAIQDKWILLDKKDKEIEDFLTKLGVKK